MRRDDETFNWTQLPFVATVARLLCRELTLQNEYLRAENRVLKSRIKGRIRFTDEDRRALVDAALAMGRKLMRQVVGIVKPETIFAWQRRLERQKWDYSAQKKHRPGRPRTVADIEALVCRMARENGFWGYRRIHGELLKLDIEVSKGGIADILRRNSLPPSPQRTGITWREFLSRHADALLCCDFLTQEVWTAFGLKTAYVLFVMHLKTRRILLAEATFSPHKQWMAQMARNVLMKCDDLGIEPRFIIHDRDVLFGHGFDHVMELAQVRPVLTPYRAPNANAYAERWVRSVRRECLSHLIFFGLRHLQRALDTYTHFYRLSRPHQGIGNKTPESCCPKPHLELGGKPPGGRIVCEEKLGGLLRRYYRQAA